MPTGLKDQKRPRDLAPLAQLVVAVATGKVAELKSEAGLENTFSRLGVKGAPPAKPALTKKPVKAAPYEAAPVAQATLYIAQPFSLRGRRLVPGAAVKLPSEQEAHRRAERIAVASGNVGAWS